MSETVTRFPRRWAQSEQIGELTTTFTGDFNIESRENEEEYSRATEAYLKIEPELSKIQREAVQRYIDTLQAADTDQTDNAYIAGIRDGIRFMVSFGLIEPAGKLPFGLGDLQAK